MFSALLSLSSNAQWQTIGPGGGIIRCFVSGGTNIFAGTDGGGVFLTSNNGGLWTSVNIGLTNTEVYALATANSGATVFAGTYGGGVFLSTNSGNSWTAVNTGLTNLQVNALAISGSAIFAGTNAGVFISNNNGGNWTAVNNGLTAMDVLSFTVSGTNILAGTGNGGVFLSTNNGGLWTQKNNGLGNTYVNALAVNGAKLFAGTDGSIYISIDNATTWTLAQTTPGLVKSIDINGTTIYAGYGTMTPTGGIVNSIDNGVNWTTVSNGLPGNKGVYAVKQSGSLVFAGTDGAGLYTTSNNGSLWASDQGITNTDANSLSLATIGTNIIAGVYGTGMFLSTNNGAGPWTPINTGLPSTNLINALATNGTTTVFTGTYANGVYRTTDNGTTWTAMNTGLGTNLNVTSFAISGSTIYAGTFGGGVFKSTITGSSWTPVNTGITNLQIQSLVASGTKVFAGTFYGGGVYFSNNSGSTWTHINNGLTNTNVNTLAISGTRVFAGTVAGVFSSPDNGSNWTQLNFGLTNQTVMSLLVSGAEIFAGTDGGGVFFSNDSANHWIAANTGLTSFNVYSLAISDSIIFAGTHGGGVWKRPQSDFDFHITTQSANTTTCAGTDSYMSVAATGGYISYQWQWSYDGGITFNDCFNGTDYSGVYTDSLTIIGSPSFFNQNKYHCIITSGIIVNSTLATLTVNQIPNLSVTNPPAACLPGTVDITNSFTDLNSTTGTISYWADAGATTMLTIPSAIASSGTYYIKKTTTSGSCTDIKPVTVLINATPNLSITNPGGVCSPNTIDITNTFTDLNSTTGTISYWTDAGATAALTTPSAITTGGIYYIKKTGTGTCSDIKPVTVTINAVPHLSVSNPPAVCFPNTVNITTIFTDLNSTTGTVSYWTDPATTIPLILPTAISANGTYYIKKTATGGCSDKISVKVIIRPLPTVHYVQSPTVLCITDAPLTLTGGSPAGGIFSGTGVTSNTFNPSTAGTGTWNIVYTYTDVYTCSDTAIQSLSVDVCTGIQSGIASNISAITLFPNPFNASITLAGIKGSADLLLYNLLGAEVGSWKINNENTTLETGNLPSGIYLLQIKTEEGILVKKIIKE